MIPKGDRLENPVTGEVLVFHRTSFDEAARRTLPLLEAPSGVVVVADDTRKEVQA